MNDNLKDILSNLNPDIDQETLMLYLQGKLSAEQQHNLEKEMMDNDFEADALEGLQSMDDKKKISALVNNLNDDLRRRTEKKKKTREKLRLKDEPWLWITIMIILLLIVLSYFIIHHQLRQR
jgi:hypothetical protein